MYSFLDCGREGMLVSTGDYILHPQAFWPCPDGSHGLPVTCYGHDLQGAAVSKSGEEESFAG